MADFLFVRVSICQLQTAEWRTVEEPSQLFAGDHSTFLRSTCAKRQLLTRSGLNVNKNRFLKGYLWKRGSCGAEFGSKWTKSPSFLSVWPLCPSAAARIITDWAAAASGCYSAAVTMTTVKENHLWKLRGLVMSSSLAFELFVFNQVLQCHLHSTSTQ